MEAVNGIDNGKTIARKKQFDLFRPISVKIGGRRIQSPNWCVRFQHQGKRTCRSLGTADYRLAQQRARELIKAVRSGGWASAIVLPTSHGSTTLDDFLERYHSSAVSRGLRPRSIRESEKDLRRIGREVSARRLADLTVPSLQGWVESCGLKPVTVRSVLKGAACPFSRLSLQAMGMAEVANPFAKLVRPKVDREPFNAPSRTWITNLMQQGISQLTGAARLAFALALGVGLRRGEILSLNWEDVRPDSIRIPAGKAKGRRARIIPIGKLVGGVLKSSKGQGAVITSPSPEVCDTLCAWLRERGIKDRKPIHYLRKCFGSLAVADHGIYIASKLLGHSSIILTASTYAGQVDRLPAVKF